MVPTPFLWANPVAWVKKKHQLVLAWGQCLTVWQDLCTLRGVSQPRTLSAPSPLQNTHTHTITHIYMYTHIRWGHRCVHCICTRFFSCLVCWFYLITRKVEKKNSNPDLCEASQTKLFTCACRMSEMKDFDQREFFSFSFVVELCGKLMILMTTYQIFISNYGKIFLYHHVGKNI